MSAKTKTKADGKAIILVELHILPDVRKTPIKSQYRPDWVSSRKPEYNCARVILVPDPSADLAPGETGAAILQPMKPELWTVEVGDVLEAREGLRTVAYATVHGTLGLSSEPADEWPFNLTREQIVAELDRLARQDDLGGLNEQKLKEALARLDGS